MVGIAKRAFLTLTLLLEYWWFSSSEKKRYLVTDFFVVVNNITHRPIIQNSARKSHYLESIECSIDFLKPAEIHRTLRFPLRARNYQCIFLNRNRNSCFSCFPSHGFHCPNLKAVSVYVCLLFAQNIFYSVVVNIVYH